MSTQWSIVVDRNLKRSFVSLTCKSLTPSADAVNVCDSARCRQLGVHLTQEAVHPSRRISDRDGFAAFRASYSEGINFDEERLGLHIKDDRIAVNQNRFRFLVRSGNYCLGPHDERIPTDWQ